MDQGQHVPALVMEQTRARLSSFEPGFDEDLCVAIGPARCRRPRAVQRLDQLRALRLVAPMFSLQWEFDKDVILDISKEVCATDVVRHQAMALVASTH